MPNLLDWTHLSYVFVVVVTMSLLIIGGIISGVIHTRSNFDLDMQILYADQTARIHECVNDARELGYEATYQFGDDKEFTQYRCNLDLLDAQGEPVTLWGAKLDKSRLR